MIGFSSFLEIGYPDYTFLDVANPKSSSPSPTAFYSKFIDSFSTETTSVFFFFTTFITFSDKLFSISLAYLDPAAT